MDVIGADGAAIAAAIGEAEERTAAELVVVVARRCGSYRDVVLAAAAACAFVTLAVVLHVEVEVSEPLVLAATAAGAALGAGAAASPLGRLLTGAARRVRQAEDAARLAFLAQGVDRTRGRTGVLVHVALHEQRVSLVADRAVVSEVGPAELELHRGALQATLGGGAPAFGAALVALGEALGKRLPRLPGDVDELPNAPVEAAA